MQHLKKTVASFLVVITGCKAVCTMHLVSLVFEDSRCDFSEEFGVGVDDGFQVSGQMDILYQLIPRALQHLEQEIILRLPHKVQHFCRQLVALAQRRSQL